MRISAMVAMLIMGGSALQQTRDVPYLGGMALQMKGMERVCEGEHTPYEMISALYPNVCTVFCVPPGECEDEAKAGKLNSFGIARLGTCTGQGYTESASIGNVMQKWFETFQGPCKGMTLSKIQKPVFAAKKKVVDEKVCGKDQRPFEGMNPRDPGICSVFCVPEGQCEGEAQTGKFKYFGITGEGNCKSNGYTKAAKLGNSTQQKMTQDTLEWLKELQGPCKGMTLSKFQKPDIPNHLSKMTKGHKETRQDKVCEKEQAPYKMTSYWYPGVCHVFCVPSGDCEDQAQKGKLNYLGITGQGNCLDEGYTQFSFLGNVTMKTQEYLESVQGPCKGMTITKFEKPKKPLDLW